jgi:homoserine dehydrogenase
MIRVPIILFGAGGVGRALLQQLIDSKVRVAERNQIDFQVVAVADSQSWLFEPDGMGIGALRDVMLAKKNGRFLAPDTSRPTDLEIVQYVAAAGVERAIVVDVTAVSGMEPVFDFALEQGYGVALANKKAMAGPWETAQNYYSHPLVRHESTVGGGQPVIATLRYLLDVNDPIYTIEGQLSGSLGFICGQLDKGVPFSEAVAEAKALGFTEPDPRDDLGGMDAMRKVMILGRMAGWPLEESDIDVESLYTPELADLSVPDFMAQVNTLDAVMKQRVDAAAAKGNVLRFVAELQEGSGTVGLKPIPANSALSNLKYISFRTQRYNDEALLIGGKGAGVEMTAAGVLGDMIDLVRENF